MLSAQRKVIREKLWEGMSFYMWFVYSEMWRTCTCRCLSPLSFEMFQPCSTCWLQQASEVVLLHITPDSWDSQLETSPLSQTDSGLPCTTCHLACKPTEETLKPRWLGRHICLMSWKCGRVNILWNNTNKLKEQGKEMQGRRNSLSICYDCFRIFILPFAI